MYRAGGASAVRVAPGAYHVQAVSLRIGTRGSPLALVQAREVRARLMAAHGLPETAFEIHIIKTSGDSIQDRPLADVGGKGLFTKEIEEALLAGSIDLAVHSMKDVPTLLPHGLIIAAVLPREDVRDAFISLKHRSLAGLPAGAVVGTSSLRRAAQVLNLRPDLAVVPFRGNVDTRLKKLEDGMVDATFLAAAGLNRLGLAHRVTVLVNTEEMLPAVAQGAVGIEIRAGDENTARLLATLDHQETAICIAAERAFLARLEGSCRTPMAGLARLSAGEVELAGLILAPDGQTCFRTRRRGRAAAAIALGETAADHLLLQAGPKFLEQFHHST